MTNRFYHAATTATVQFSRNPNRGNGEQAERRQSAGYDSTGSIYVYSRNAIKQRIRTLVYSQQSGAILTALLAFVQARGDKEAFTWDDHLSVVHTVHFSVAGITYTETGPGRFRLEVSINEES